MRFALFYHSGLSDWNHGNAHFLRGVASELQLRGHQVRIYEPSDAWSATNLVADHGERALNETRRVYRSLRFVRYDRRAFDLERAVAAADVVLVHEWNDHDLVATIGELRRRLRSFVLLFHDTHHRSVTDTADMAAYDLSSYDGVLAFGRVITERYLVARWASRVWTWHEAAYTRVFRPRPGVTRERDLAWIGNWGDEERTAELREFLIEPVRRLGLTATVYGVRYPAAALNELGRAGITYGGWLPNFRVPEVFARHRVTVHIPRRPYVETLHGIPTIRPFEALACGIPLVCAPWYDVERLFERGEDYLVAHDGPEMETQLRKLLADPALRGALAAHGRRTILARHTCAHRADELLNIVAAVRGGRPDRVDVAERVASA